MKQRINLLNTFGYKVYFDLLAILSMISEATGFLTRDKIGA